MKARRKDSNDEWQDIAYVQLVDSYVIQPADRMEFDTLSTEQKTNSQIADEAHWQDVRESAAIAAMQGMLANPELIENTGLGGRDYRWQIEQWAISYADSLVEQLKKK